jgi:hypothetical protein
MERQAIPALRIRRGPQRVGARTAPVLRAAFKRNGFTHPEIVAKWPLIVGPALARHTMPERLRRPRGGEAEGAGLHVRVDGALGIELLHVEPVVIERINTFYGYRAVARLRLIQGPLPPKPAAPPERSRPLSESEEAALGAFLDRVEDARLKSALAALGRGVMGYIG